MIKGTSVNQILLKTIKQTKALICVKVQTNLNTVIGGDLNTPLSLIHWSSRPKKNQQRNI